MIRKRNTILFSLAFIVCMFNAKLYAAEQPVVSGVCGTCIWSVVDGTLSIEAQDGVSGTLDDWGDGVPPWVGDSVPRYSRVKFVNEVKALTCARMFYGRKGVLFDFRNFDTSEVKDMSYMFAEMSPYSETGEFDFNTSKVEDMSYMFYRSGSAQKLIFRNFDLANVRNMSHMFDECGCLEQCNILDFKASKVEDMSYMFHGCKLLELYDLSNYDTSNVKDMSYMFAGSIVKNIDLSSLNLQNLQTVNNMFGNCFYLVYVNFDNPTTHRLEDTSFMFSNCKRLKEVQAGRLNTSNLKICDGMFWVCDVLEYIETGQWDFSNVYSMSAFNTSCLRLKSFVLPQNTGVSDVNITGLLWGCEKVEYVDMSGWSNDRVVDNGSFSLICLTNVKHFILPSLYGPWDDERNGIYKPVPEGIFRSVEDGDLFAPKGKVFSDDAPGLLEYNTEKGGGTYVRVEKADASFRSLSANWGTMCYPADVTLPAGVRAFVATGVEDGEIVIREVKQVVPAHMPVMLYSENGSNIELPEAYYSIYSGEIRSEGNLLVGCNGSFALDKESQYVMQMKDGDVGFYSIDPNSPMTTTSFRAFLSLDDTQHGARKRLGIRIEEDGITTDVSVVNTEKSCEDTYSLNGTKVNSVRKGNVYVRGGKKAYAK